jgi:hypothetical protein
MPVTLYREQISRTTIAQVKAQNAPRVFRKMTSVTLLHGVESCVVNLRRIDGHGCVTKTTVFECPHCMRLVRVVAFTCWGVRCLRCAPWRSREYHVPSTARAPHLRPVVAVADES